VTFRLSTEQFAYHDIEMRRIVEPGMIRLFVGRSSVDLPLTAEIALVGPTFALVERHDYVTRTAVDWQS
jgi:beta-glucosidase